MKFLLGLLVCAAPALAAERPSLPPTEDAAVTYRAEGEAAEILPNLGAPSGPALLHLFWSANTPRLRIEVEGRPQFLLVDVGAHAAQLVDRGLRSAVTLPVRAKDLEALTLQGETLTRQGEARYAGHACTNWAVHSDHGDGTVCLTPSGLPLHAAGVVDGRKGSFTATKVQLGPQPATLFAVPDGYMAFALPSFGKFK